MENRYQELRERQQKEFDALPLGFAFGDKQFEEMMKGWGLDAKKDEDLAKIYSIGYGGYIQKKDSTLLHEIRERHDKEMEDAIVADETGEGFIFEMFLYELDNHEYGYTGDPEGALDALGYTADEVLENQKLKRGLEKAVQFIRDRESGKRTVTFMAAKNGTCEDLYRCSETGKVYIRQKCDEGHVRWLTTTDDHEADSPMRKGLVIRAVDKAGSTLFVEEIVKDEGMDSTWAVKDGPFSWEAIKALAEEVRSKNDLTAYDEWKAWLLADMPKDANIYPDNWLFAMTDRGLVKKLARMDFLGVTVFATSQELKHSTCGKSWVIYEIRDADLTSCLALCGFKYEKEGSEK